MKPILFNTEMVRAILEGRKTVTRRVVKPQPTPKVGLWVLDKSMWSDGAAPFRPMPGHSLYNSAPYRPGDILYVRETWNRAPFGWDDEFIYKADSGWGPRKPWRPSIHMPKEAARLFLRVKDVRVERLQDITVGGVLCEGTQDETPPAVCQGEISFPEGFSHWSEAVRNEWINSVARARYIGWCDYADKLLRKFEGVWDGTIKPADLPLYGWAANPWVWVIEFERISKEEAYRNGGLLL